MPFEFEYSEAAGLLHVRSHGAGSLEDVLGGCSRLEHYVRATPELDILIDNTAYTYNPSASELREIVSRLASFRGALTGRLAVVATSGLQFGIGRMFGTFAELAGLRVRLFRTSAKAMEYLHTPRPGRA